MLKMSIAACAVAAVSTFMGGVTSGRLLADVANAQAYTENTAHITRVGIKQADNFVSQYRHAVSQRLTQHLRRTAGDRVFFGSGSSRLGSNARIVLSAQARWMKLRPSFGALIIGHADDPGSIDDNTRLASERARAVQQRLIDEGISPERIVIEIRGRAEPIAYCDAQQCAAQNRRAITQVLHTLPSSVLRQKVPPGDKFDNALHRGAALSIP